MNIKFSSHEKSKYWSKKNLDGPEKYALNSHKKCWFDCDTCGHCFDAVLNNINANNSWCIYCADKKICHNEECKSCYDKSFASNPKSIYWSNKNELSPRQVFKSTDRKKFEFNCDCGHIFNITLKAITSQNRWCSFCSHQKLCDNNLCNMCFNNSFASVIDKCKLWSDKNELTPRQVFKSTNNIFIFNCENCDNEYKKILSDVTRGIGCPHCFNKTEQKIYDLLLPIYSSITRQFKNEWCKNIRMLPYDFIIPNLKIIIELDGKQHFEQISNWLSPKETRKTDLHKIKCANENGFSMIRLLQKDVWLDKYDWLQEIKLAIEKIVEEQKVQNIYICKKNEYDNFELELE